MRPAHYLVVAIGKEDASKAGPSWPDLIGNFIGTAVTVLHPDPAGAVLGTGAAYGTTKVLYWVGEEFHRRFLSKREAYRIGTLLFTIDAAIKEKLEAGAVLRDDGFFAEDSTGRSQAYEIAEAVLIAAQREHEERKLPYIANLFAFVAVTSGIDRSMANHMVRTASSLSYRQFCVLALANDPIRNTLHSAPYYGGAGGAAAPLFTLLSEIFELYQDRLLEMQGTFGQMTRPPNDPRSMPLQNLQLGELGTFLHLAMGLSAMQQSEYADIIRALSG